MTRHLKMVLFAAFLGFSLIITAGLFEGCKSRDAGDKASSVEKTIEKSSKMMKTKSAKKKRVKKERQPKPEPVAEFTEEQLKEIEKQAAENLKKRITEDKAEEYILHLEKKIEKDLERENES